MSIEPWVTEQAISQHLSVSLSWLRADRAKPCNLIPYIKLGNSVRYKMSAVAEAVDKLARTTSAPAPAPAPAPPPAPSIPPRRRPGRPRNSEVHHG